MTNDKLRKTQPAFCNQVWYAKMNKQSSWWTSLKWDICVEKMMLYFLESDKWARHLLYCGENRKFQVFPRYDPPEINSLPPTQTLPNNTNCAAEKYMVFKLNHTRDAPNWLTDTTFIVTLQLRVTGGSICNSCDIFCTISHSLLLAVLYSFTW